MTALRDLTVSEEADRDRYEMVNKAAASGRSLSEQRLGCVRGARSGL